MSKQPSPDYRVRGGGGGGFEFLLGLVLLVLGILAVAKYYGGESPQQLWQSAVDFAELCFHPPPPTPVAKTIRASPAPVPTPVAPASAVALALAPVPVKPAPEPDPLTWLAAHRESWPAAVMLKTDTIFPVLLNGKETGSGNVPAGSQLQIVEIAPPNVTLSSSLYGGGTKSVPIVSTNLVDLARTQQQRTEAAALVPTAPPSPAAIATAKAQPNHRSGSPVLALDDEDDASEGDKVLGAIYQPEATTFRVFAEKANSVKLVLYDQAGGAAGRSVRPLDQEEDGLWELTVKGDLRGKFYAYLFDGPDLDPAREVLDPYAVNGEASRGRITELPGNPSAGPAVDCPTDMVIYEMHVRDFTIAENSGVQNKGHYLGWTEAGTRLDGSAETRTALDHLVELGVTHVQIMPVQEFDDPGGGYNWGYVTDAYFSPEGIYASHPDDDSRVREFKALVDALHARGIGVIMDVVFNHTAADAPFQSIDPLYYYRHLPDGSMANGSGCGNEFRSEAPMARKLILDSLKFWVREYGIDGFRFDLMALIDRETMRQAEHQLRQLNPNIVLYGEPWEPGISPLQSRTDKGALRDLAPIGAFNDDFRNALKGEPDGAAPGWIQNGSNRDALKAAMSVSGWLQSPGQSINYLTCHDNLVLWDKLKLSMPDATDPLLEDTVKLGSLVLFTSQGVPFLQGGEEFARTKGGNNNSYDASDSVNEVDWSLKKTHQGLFNYTRDLIALRKAHPVFRLRTRDQVDERLAFVDPDDDRTLMFTLDGGGIQDESWKRVCVVLNSRDSSEAQVELPPGRWSVAFDEGGAVTGERSLAGKISVHPKSGLVLYQPK